MFTSKRSVVVAVLLAVSILAASCSAPTPAPTATPDGNMVKTSVNQTVVAQLTRQAQLNPSATMTQTQAPTNTPVPVTPTPTVPTSTPTIAATITLTKAADAAEFVSQSLADGANLTPSTSFTVVWKLKNVGSTTWTTGYSLRFFSGEKMGAPDAVNLTKEVKPQDSVEISVNMKSPSSTGSYRGNWVLSTNLGYNFYPVFISINVVNANTSTPTTAPSVTPTVTKTP